MSKTPLKVIVFGAGMVGEKLFEVFRGGIDVTWSKGRITTKADLEKVCEKLHPDLIVNAIGKTGKPNVDWCEDHKEETYFSNVEIPRMMSAVADDRKIHMVQISSGCVYSGSSEKSGGFIETDRPNFDGSFYSFTKYVAEHLISYKPNVLTVRLRIPLLPDKGERGIIAKLMKYKTIIDTPNSISYLPDFINAVYLLCVNNQAGIWNITNPEAITHRRILEIYDWVNGTDIVATKKFISAKELKTKAPRSNCILSTEKIQEFLKSVGSEMRHTEDAVRLAAKGYGL